jgi:hypothetical protein
MRRLASIFSIALISLGLTSCGEEELPLYAIMNYQMGCLYAGGCTGFPARQFETLNGADGYNVTCSVMPAGANMLLNLNVDHPSGNPDEDYGFRINNAQFAAGGAAVAGGCTAVVTEGANEYSGPCGAAPPADGCRDRDDATGCPQPCRLFDLFIEETENGPTLRGKLFCEGLPLGADPTRHREVHAPLNGAEPATFAIENCDGL